MEMSKNKNGSQWAHDIFLMNKAGATEYTTGRSSTLFILIFAVNQISLLLIIIKLKIYIIFIAKILNKMVQTSLKVAGITGGKDFGVFYFQNCIKSIHALNIAVH